MPACLYYVWIYKFFIVFIKILFSLDVKHSSFWSNQRNMIWCMIFPDTACSPSLFVCYNIFGINRKHNSRGLGSGLGWGLGGGVSAFPCKICSIDEFSNMSSSTSFAVLVLADLSILTHTKNNPIEGFVSTLLRFRINLARYREQNLFGY
jgi:hypothetical protein